MRRPHLLRALAKNQTTTATRAKQTEEAEASLIEFVRQAWHVVEPGKEFSESWHIAAICEHLEAVHRGQIRRLLVNVPFRSSKSTLTSVMWPAWTWIHRPSHQWLCGSYALKLAIRDSLKMRRLVTSPWYAERWGNRFAITSDQNQKIRFENDRAGYRIAFSLEGGVMGDGGDSVLVDDPHDRDQAHSDAERETALTTFDEGVSTRLNDPETSAIVIIMQRLHQEDLSGHVLARGGYEHLLIPMHYDPKRSRATVLRWKDPRTEPGQLMDEKRFPAHVVAEIERDIGSYAAAGQLEQAPSPAEGGIIKRAWWKFYDAAPEEFEEQLQSWDCAVKDTADYVAGQAWGRVGPNCYLVDEVYERLDFPATVAAFRRFAALHPAGVKLVEDKANGPAVIATLRDQVPGIVAVNPDGSKEARAFAVTPYIEAGNVWLPNPYDATGNPRADRLWVLRLIDNCAAFPNALHDDDVDALTQALHRLMHGGGFLGYIAADMARRRGQHQGA